MRFRENLKLQPVEITALMRGKSGMKRLRRWAHGLTRRETGDEAAWFVEFATAYLRKGR